MAVTSRESVTTGIFLFMLILGSSWPDKIGDLDFRVQPSMNKGEFAMNEKLFHSDSFMCTYCWIGIWRTALYYIGNFKSQRLLDFIFKCIDWTIVSSFVCSGVVSIWCPFLSLYWRSRRTAKFCINDPQYRKGVWGRPFCWNIFKLRLILISLSAPS